MSRQNGKFETQRVKSSLNHPVIDVDAHHLEFRPLLDEYLREGMGRRLFEKWQRQQHVTTPPISDRRMRRLAQPGWWTAPPVTRPADRAAAALPRLFVRRLDEFGIDFVVLYTSAGLKTLLDPDDEMRRRFCHSINEFYADCFLQYGQRLTPAAIVPMYTPGEAIEELQHCHNLGLKVVQLPHGIPRPIPHVHAHNPNLYPEIHWLDTYGVDSAYDYDVFWRQLSLLGFAATFHGHSSHAAAGKSSRSVSNYVFNHMGAHATLMTDLCKSLVLGGITRRFSNLQFAFLEAGAAWAELLVHDMMEHWRKRGRDRILRHDPRRLDLAAMRALFGEWADEHVDTSMLNDPQCFYANRRENFDGDTAEPDCHDDFNALEIRELGDIASLFANVYCGCGPGDPSLGAIYRAGDAMPLHPLFSSDFGHWDTAEPEMLLPDGYQMVADGAIRAYDFQRFVADDAIRLYGVCNRTFWSGTAVEDYAKTVLGDQD